MKANLQYLWYVIRHKWFVFLAGLRTGAPLSLLILHDSSKFSREEWGPYVDKFYRDKHPLTSENFLKAFRSHSKKNPHHWQYWSERRNSPEAIPDHYLREMVADWMGAGRAITGKWDVDEWYAKNKDKIQLHPATRGAVEQLIEEVTKKDPKVLFTKRFTLLFLIIFNPRKVYDTANEIYWDGWKEGRRSGAHLAAKGIIPHVDGPNCPCATECENK